MSDLDNLGRYRGGVVYRAGNVNPVTARTWVATVGLVIGNKSLGDVHPRYDLVDAVILRIMHDLTQKMHISAAPAAAIANLIRPKLPTIVRAHILKCKENAGWIWEGGPFVVVTSNPMDRPRGAPAPLQIVPDGQGLIDALSATRSSIPLVIALPVIINSVRISIENTEALELTANEVD